jgi:hypothetical protein
LNPLNLLIACREHLRRGGRLYISTPRPFFGFLQGKQHPAEYKVDRMIKIIEFAGFTVTKTKKIMLWNPLFFFYGFRPMFRVLFHRTVLYECVK